MRLLVDVDEVHERWRGFAERTATLHADAKQLQDRDPKPVGDFSTKTAELLAQMTDAATTDFASDADGLELLTFLRDPDVVSALTAAGPRLHKLWLLATLKKWSLSRADVKSVITGYTKQLGSLKRKALKVLRAIEKVKAAATRPAPARAPGADSDDTVGRYTNLQRLGEGVFGEVFSADDQKLGRAVALKFLRTTAPDAAALAHARALARVQHPNIVIVYEVHRITDPQTNTPAHAVVMELVEGPSLAERLGRAMAADEVLRIGNAILDALAAYHAEDLAHLDLHDGNVIVGDNAVKVIDPLYMDTSAFASTIGREKQQGRDIRQARDLLVQMLHLGAVPIDAALAFERDTIGASIDTIRRRLQEALSAPLNESAASGPLARENARPIVGNFKPGPQAQAAQALLVRMASINKKGGRRVIQSIPHFSTETGMPLAEVRDAAALLKAHGYVTSQGDGNTIELTLTGRDEAHRIGVDVNSPMEDAMRLLEFLVRQKKASRLGPFDHTLLGEELRLTLGQLRDAGNTLQQLGLGEVVDNESDGVPFLSCSLSERGNEKGESFLDDLRSMVDARLRVDASESEVVSGPAERTDLRES